MNITVIICTYNRCETLNTALHSVTASKLPESVEWEVLVVDNNSSDGTRDLVNEFCKRHEGRVRYLFEPQPGKSYALNAGIRGASGDVIAFMDDDLTVEPAWLANLTAPLLQGEWAGTGGRTLLAHEFTPPPWMTLHGPQSLGGILAAQFDLGDEPRELDQPPFGANMAFRKSMFEKYGLFRTDLGPSPDAGIPRPNEDTEFGRRLLSKGERLRYEPTAVAYHPVPEKRIEKSYFLNWWFDYGRAAAREGGGRPDVLGIPRRYFSIPKIFVSMIAPAGLRWMVTLDPQRRFFSKCVVWMGAGLIREIRSQSNAAKTG